MGTKIPNSEKVEKWGRTIAASYIDFNKPNSPFSPSTLIHFKNAKNDEGERLAIFKLIPKAHYPAYTSSDPTVVVNVDTNSLQIKE